MTLRERIKEFIAYLGITQVQFERSIGVSKGYVNGLADSLPPKKIAIIEAQYPQLRRDWLLYGDGSMLKVGENHTTIYLENVGNFQVGANVNDTASPDIVERLLSLMEGQMATIREQQAALSSQQAAILNLTRKL